jgi:glutamate-1-semialdehyde 2,1-aminomutase
MLTPFHNMALMCPTTKREEIDYHTQVFHAAIKDLLSKH